VNMLIVNVLEFETLSIEWCRLSIFIQIARPSNLPRLRSYAVYIAGYTVRASLVVMTIPT